VVALNNTNDIINDVTGLNPICVAKIITPQSIAEISQIVSEHPGPISIGGGYFSMGGQVATENSLHIDMHCLNKIIEFNPGENWIRVQAGIRWREIQEHIDQYDLSIKIMQTYANFTVGGSLSVNAHGRYVGQGPLILSVKSLVVVLANGELVQASPTENTEIFYGVIGGYGGLGIIVEVVLHLVPNTKIEREQIKLNVGDYRQYFFDYIRDDKKAIFHNADLYPPHYRTARAITWVTTDKPLTVNHRIIKKKKSYAIERYFVWTITTTFTGKWRREHIFDPIIYLKDKIAWRNYEAGSYDVAELEPRSRQKNTYVLQEYFVPVMQFDEFLPKMTEILQRYQVNVMNISVRHALRDPGSILAWAREEVFAFVLYYKQQTNDLAKNKVAIWTRELIDAVLSVDGSYYLPYQLHATPTQFHQAYPRAKEFFALKRKLDLQNILRNKLWDKYYTAENSLISETISDFKKIFNDTLWRDKFYLFLQNIYNIYPENAFHLLLREACEHASNDADIYAYIQNQLSTIKPRLADIRYAIPALIKQKKEMARQTLKLLGEHKTINGYVEIGSTGRYVGELKKHLVINGPIYLVNETAPSNSPVDIAERGQIKKIGQFIPLNDYDPISDQAIADVSIDLVTCYIGLHHVPLPKLDSFVNSIYRLLKPGGIFIVRDHDVDSQQMFTFVSLVHTVFNAGLKISWENDQKELRNFTSLDHLIKFLQAHGFKNSGEKLLQAHDPTMNTLLQFVKK